MDHLQLGPLWKPLQVQFGSHLCALFLKKGKFTHKIDRNSFYYYPKALCSITAAVIGNQLEKPHALFVKNKQKHSRSGPTCIKLSARPHSQYLWYSFLHVQRACAEYLVSSMVPCQGFMQTAPGLTVAKNEWHSRGTVMQMKYRVFLLSW